MPLTNNEIDYVKETLRNSLRNKMKNYNPEPASMPFHTRLLGKDRLALYSFIHSLNTNFGTSIFEPVALALAKGRFKNAKIKADAGSYISEYAQKTIQNIIDGLTAAKILPDKEREIESIRQVCKVGQMNKVKLTKVDIFIESFDDEIYMFDLKTAKPNIGEFKGFKRTLLEWVAAYLAENPNGKIHTCIAIPYNPYEPEPYNRWTMRGMLDIDNELLVASELWNFLGDEGAYENILDCFESVGVELRSEIDEYFAKFKL
ncbi:TdeIII family type II restriction endonuclease [Mahella australiensis]|uniref:type II site-specific deoxyribonuclease n=1 Tax=Mahella australiensis (strain DSM 15567 / CIP 107919 / 50-1 BON) TaxID=697281 RepID=F3ZW06_MAHA5|nr:TdeIII family type II restriction endonuclease [Mahella australiensis]AEE95380.1 Restriction endonuclease, type II, MjaII [Mahella australiensis 50-1 BON]